MKLLTDKQRKQVPMIFTQPRIGGDAIAYIRFFTPDANWVWYVTEYDKKDVLFGFVVGTYKELGYFRLSDLEKLRGPHGLPVQRDHNWKPKKLKEIDPSFREPYGC